MKENRKKVIILKMIYHWEKLVAIWLRQGRFTSFNTFVILYKKTIIKITPPTSIIISQKKKLYWFPVVFRTKFTY